jgi:IS30 family transposase
VLTLAEWASRFCLLIALPDGRTAGKVADALADRILTLPQALRRTLTWDRGIEMAAHADFTVATGVKVYFADRTPPGSAAPCVPLYRVPPAVHSVAAGQA